MLRSLPVALISLCVFSATAFGTTWLPPARPLSEDERIELAISESDAIGLGFVTAIHDTIVAPGYVVRSLTLHPTRWFKGGPVGPSVEVGISPFDQSPLFADLLMARGLDRTPALFFLKNLGAAWALREYPDPVAPGLRLLSRDETPREEARLRRLIARQNPDSLLLRSDVVLLGRRGKPKRACSSEEGVRECVPVVPTEVLIGDSLPDSLEVYSIKLGHIPDGDALYLLRKTPEGLYETVGFRDGSLAVHDRRVDRWGLSLDQVRRKAQEAKALRARARSPR